jgi:hypothetical protein
MAATVIGKGFLSKHISIKNIKTENYNQYGLYLVNILRITFQNCRYNGWTFYEALDHSEKDNFTKAS